MIQMQTEKGSIHVNSAVFTNIVGMAASNCFGVKGMAAPYLPEYEQAAAVIIQVFHEVEALVHLCGVARHQAQVGVVM